MRAVIIGGTGHIGSYLTPRLVEAGLSIVLVSAHRLDDFNEPGGVLVPVSGLPLRVGAVDSYAHAALERSH